MDGDAHISVDHPGYEPYEESVYIDVGTTVHYIYLDPIQGQHNPSAVGIYFDDPSAVPAPGAAGGPVAASPASRPVLRLVPRGPTAEDGSRTGSGVRGRAIEGPVSSRTPPTPP